MGAAASLFYSTTNPEMTLDWRIRPSDDQFETQRERWNDLQETLLAALSDATGLSIYSWLQGSYKFGTQVRPASPGQEFDIDLGVYFVWSGKPTDGTLTAVDLKETVQDCLIAYAEDATNDAEGVSDPKPRCSRIHFNDDFHIDVPAYHLDHGRDARTLAVEDGSWENSDPKAIYKWWKEAVEGADRVRARRLVRYLKMWASLQFGDSQAPSSILLTVVAAEAYAGLDAASLTGDDEWLHALILALQARFSNSRKVPNPANTAEDLNRLTAEDHKAFVVLLDELAGIAGRAISTPSKAASAEIWAEAFEQFMEIPNEDDETVLLEKSLGRLTVQFIPEVAVTASGGGRIWRGKNEIGPIPKNCDIKFELENYNQLPAGAVVSWTVRNSGKEAERENDLGHVSSVFGFSHTETSAYHGNHFVDVAVKVNGALVGRRRIPVQVTSLGAMFRNPRRRPSYVQFRSRR